MACGILVPQPGIKPVPPAVEAWSLNHWTTREVPIMKFFFLIIFIYLFIFIFIFLAVLGLRFCARAFSSCGKRGPLFIAVRGPLHYRSFCCCGAQAPDVQAQ